MTILAPYGKDVEPPSLSKLIASASNAMPEWYPDEHIRTAQNLLTGPFSEFSAEYFKVMVYMVSNAMSIDWPSSFVAYVMGTGRMGLRGHLNRLRNESPTIQSFLEKLFQSEIYKATSLCDKKAEPRGLETLTSLLELGLDPDYPCCMTDHILTIPCTPIQEATRSGCLDVIQLLLRFQARVDRTHVSVKSNAFVNLALDAPCSNSQKLRILTVLFEHEFLNKDEMVRAAIELHDEEAILSILGCGIDVTSYESSWLHKEDRLWSQSSVSYVARPSVLMMAVQAGGRIANLMLDHLSLKGQPSPSALADAYIAAAYGGHHDIMLRLDAMHTSEVACNKEGITPLQAVVVGGDPTACKHILERQGGTTASLVLVAAILGNLRVLRLLMECGGDPSALFYTHDIQLYDYFNIGQYHAGDSDILKLIDNRKFIHRYDGHPTPVLSILMHSVSDYVFLELSVLTLIENGATIPRSEMGTFSRLCFHECLKAALEDGGNPNDVDEKGDTMLQCALNNDFFDGRDDQAMKRLLTVELLIKAGAKLTGGEVVRAIYLREWSLVSFLLQNGGNLNDVDDTGRGCLEAEIEAQNDRTLQDVLEAQELPIDAGPFCASLRTGDWALVRRLLKRAHKPTGCHLVEGTAVGLAARAGQLDILDKLLARFTDPSVLSLARIPEYIFASDVYSVTKGKGWVAGFWRRATDRCFSVGSPLALVAYGGNTCGFGELLRRGCKMDTVSWAVVAHSTCSSEYLQLLKEFSCGLGNATEYGKQFGTALWRAINHRKFDLAQYLVEVGADVDEYDIFESGCTSPLQCAINRGLIEVAAYLLEKEANINAPPAFEKGATALQFAAIHGHIGLARQLIELGARINARGSGKDGRSALEGAAEHGRLDMLALLVHHGADTTGPGRQQLINSVAFAQQNAHITAAEWLKKNCGWCDEDQRQLKFVNADADYPVGECIRAYCCDEYHDSDTQCVYHYTEEQRQVHYDDCKRCEDLTNHLDDSNLSSKDEEMASSEDEEMDSSEDDEVDSEWVDDDHETAQSLDVMEQCN